MKDGGQSTAKDTEKFTDAKCECIFLSETYKLKLDRQEEVNRLY